jgi:hypothetical protein
MSNREATDIIASGSSEWAFPIGLAVGTNVKDAILVLNGQGKLEHR